MVCLPYKGRNALRQIVGFVETRFARRRHRRLHRNHVAMVECVDDHVMVILTE